MNSLIEYGQIPKDGHAKRNVLASGVNKEFNLPYKLIHSTSGYECAGSMARYTNEKYGCIFTDRNGTTGGQWFSAEQTAREYFAKVTA